MVQTTSHTVNPAGAPRVKEVSPDPYTRADFIRDLSKVSKKPEPQKKS